MTQSQIKKLKNRIEILREDLSENVGSSTMDIINDLVECEILLETECNK